MFLIEDEIAAITEREAKATAGEWVLVGPSANADLDAPLQWQHRYEIREVDAAPGDTHHWPYRICQTIEGQMAPQAAHDFKFIAHARTDIPRLVHDWRAQKVTIEALTAERDALRAACDEDVFAEMSALKAEVETLRNTLALLKAEK